jgi:hypothetical protein
MGLLFCVVLLLLLPLAICVSVGCRVEVDNTARGVQHAGEARLFENGAVVVGGVEESPDKKP